MKFINYYRKIMNEDTSSHKGLPFAIFKTEITKGTIITDYDSVENRVYFINKGIIELAIKNDISEKILDFFFPEETVTCLTSFLLQIPSDTKMTALTDCQLEYFEHHDVYSNYPTSIEANQLGRILVEHAYLRKAKREKEFLSKTAEELYLELIEEHSKYIQQLPVNKLAKYLGIQPESLSRIRKKISF